MAKKAKPPAKLKLVSTDRVEIVGGALRPRCAAVMQRYRRPAGYKPPNSTPFNSVILWDRCTCGYIVRLEEIDAP